MVNFLKVIFHSFFMSLLLLQGSYLTPLANAAVNFPYGRCYDRACGSSPYVFTWISSKATANQSESQACFEISARTCEDSKYVAALHLRRN